MVNGSGTGTMATLIDPTCVPGLEKANKGRSGGPGSGARMGASALVLLNALVE